MKLPKLLVHCPHALAFDQDILDAIEVVDPQTQIKRNWNTVIEHLEAQTMSVVDVVIDVLGQNARVGLEHQRELWDLRVAHNYSPIPIYFAIGCTALSPALRYEIRRLGGHFMDVSEVRRFLSEMEEIQLQLDEVKECMPHWEIIEETCGRDPQRVYVHLRFGGKAERLQGSDRHHAVLAVLLKNNGLPRSMNSLLQLCSEDSLFCPAGGPFAVPRRATLKAYLYRDFPEYFQRAFDAVRSGYRAQRIIEHLDVGTKSMAYRIRGVWMLTLR